MSTPLPPGIGNTQQAAQATGFIREQPWYLQYIQSLGKDPNGQLNLSDDQEAQLGALAQQHGIGMNSKFDGIGPNGDIIEEHHKLKKAAIAAAIGGLALTGFGAAGIGPMSGMFGASTIAGATPISASMTGLGTGAGALVPATTSSLAAGLGTGAAAGIGGAAGAGSTLAALGSSAIPSMTGLGAGAGALVPATTSSLAGAGIGASAGAAGGAEALEGGAEGALPAGATAAPTATGAATGAENAGVQIANGIGSPGSLGYAPGIGQEGGATSLTKTGSILSKLTDPSNLADAGSALSAYANDAQGNRFLQGNFTQAYDRNMLQAQTDRNANESDAMKKLQQTSYLLGGGSQAKAPTLSLNNKSYQTPDFGFTPPVSDATKAGAQSLQNQLGGRLQPGGSYTPQPLSSYGTPQTGEKVASTIGASLGTAGTILNMFR